MDTCRKDQLLPLLVLLVTITQTLCQVCPQVSDCVEVFTSTMSHSGHDQEIYCRQESILIQCIKAANCSAQTAKYKTSELKHFQEDGQCDVANIHGPVLPVLITAISLCLLLNLVTR